MMETLVMVLMVVVCFNFILKQTYQKVWQVVLMGAIAAAFVGLSWPWAIEQSKTQLVVWLGDRELMLNIAVVLTLEVVIQLSYCMLCVDVMTSGKLPRRTIWLYRALRFFPGVVIFPVLFTALVWVIFAFPGKDFSTVAWSLAAGVFVVVVGGSFALKWLLPEKDLRLEVLFLTYSLTAILGVVATSV